ncbi:hypothetical protein RIR_jg40071.t1 [Rhizophagus irregularis DAOM 181602=DAOM 197198]|nr:hypothetical protein RIR_jg40071.t1 [Rhizophagus irregularis DAOM 181602=DAOM 197198]
MNPKEKERDGFNFFNKINRINKNEDYYYSQTKKDYQEKNIQTEEKERVVFNFFNKKNRINKEKNIQTVLIIRMKRTIRVKRRSIIIIRKQRNTIRNSLYLSCLKKQSDYYYPQEKNIQAKMRSFLSVGRFR